MESEDVSTLYTRPLPPQNSSVSEVTSCKSSSSRAAIQIPLAKTPPMTPCQECGCSFKLMSVMLSSEGLQARKLNSEGSSSPVVLRLLQHGSGSLSLSWVERDGTCVDSAVEMDMRRLTTVCCGREPDARPAETDRRVRCNRSCENEDLASCNGNVGDNIGGGQTRSLLALAWDRHDAFEVSAEDTRLVIQATSEAERDSLVRCFRLIMSELRGEGNTHSVSGNTTTESTSTNISTFCTAQEYSMSLLDSAGTDLRKAAPVAAGETEGDAVDVVTPLVNDSKSESNRIPPRSGGIERYWSVDMSTIRQLKTGRRSLGIRTRSRQCLGRPLHGTLPRRESTCELTAEERAGLQNREVMLLKRMEESLVRMTKLCEHGRAESKAASCLAAVVKLEKLLSAAGARDTKQCWLRWCSAVRRANRDRMLSDRRQWCLHATANAGYDLQAWYHSTFHREVYRLRGPFWYKCTRLQKYHQKAYRISDGDPLTVMEKNVMRSCRWSSGTRYPDIMVHVFTAQGVLSREEYLLFQKLIARDVAVQKAAPVPGKKQSRPRPLRLSFVRGGLYLTWKCKPDSAGNTFDGFNFAKIVYVERCNTPPMTVAFAGLASHAPAPNSGRHRQQGGDAEDTRSEDSAGDSRDSRGAPLTVTPGTKNASTAGVMSRRFNALRGERGIAELQKRKDCSSPEGKRIPSVDMSAGPCHPSSGTKRLNLPYEWRRRGSPSDDGGWSRDKGVTPGAPAPNGESYVGRGIAGLAVLRRSSISEDESQHREDNILSSSEISHKSSEFQRVVQAQGDHGSVVGTVAAADEVAEEGTGAAAASAGAGAGADAIQEPNIVRSQRTDVERGCLLSVHFHGMPRTLDLWFSAEAEAKTWQSMLMKLAMKEQGRGYTLSGRKSAPRPPEAKRDGRAQENGRDMAELEGQDVSGSDALAPPDCCTHGHDNFRPLDACTLPRAASAATHASLSRSPDASASPTTIADSKTSMASMQSVNPRTTPVPAPVGSSAAALRRSSGSGRILERWWPYHSPQPSRRSGGSVQGSLDGSVTGHRASLGSIVDGDGEGVMFTPDRRSWMSPRSHRSAMTPDWATSEQSADDWLDPDEILSEAGSPDGNVEKSKREPSVGGGVPAITHASPTGSSGSSGGWGDQDYRMGELLRHVSLGSGLCPAR